MGLHHVKTEVLLYFLCAFSRFFSTPTVPPKNIQATSKIQKSTVREEERKKEKK